MTISLRNLRKTEFEVNTIVVLDNSSFSFALFLGAADSKSFNTRRTLVCLALLVLTILLVCLLNEKSVSECQQQRQKPARSSSFRRKDFYTLLSFYMLLVRQLPVERVTLLPRLYIRMKSAVGTSNSRGNKPGPGT